MEYWVLVCVEVLFLIKISKNFLFNPARIWVSGIKCNFKNIAKITSVLDCKSVVVTIDSLTKDSSLLSLVMNQGLRYFLKQHSANYIEVSVVIPYSLFEDILEKAISENPENIFVFNLLDPTNWDIHLQHPFEDLFATGITNVFISISLDENALLISVSKSSLQPKALYQKIKALRFD